MKLRHFAFTTAILLACDSSGNDAPAPKKHAPEDVEARATEIYGHFKTMYDNLPDAGAEAMACPDEKVRGWGEEDEITFIAYQSLHRTVGETWDGNESLVRFMTDGKLRYAPQPDFKLDAEENIRQVMRMWNFVHYVGVVVPRAERKSSASSGYAGDAGAFSGQLVIYKKDEPNPICHTPFSVVGSGGVSYSYKLSGNSDDRKSAAAYALKKSLCGDISTTLKAKISGISKVLKADYIDCNSV